jgi:hypothetical protein
MFYIDHSDEAVRGMLVAQDGAKMWPPPPPKPVTPTPAAAAAAAAKAAKDLEPVEVPLTPYQVSEMMRNAHAIFLCVRDLCFIL